MSSKPLSGLRFWRWYVLAWLDLAGLYTVVFLITGSDTFFAAVVGSLIYVTPMALLGLAALVLFRRLSWETPRRVGFVALHVATAFVFGVGATSLNYLQFRLASLISPQHFPPRQFHLEYFTWECLMGMLIYGVLAAVCYGTLLARRIREQEARAAQAIALQTEAELRALRAQLNPHFLFNTLHSLLALVRRDPRAAEDGLERFGDLLRYTLDTQKNGEVVPLQDELTFVENYLSLESLRLGDRLRLDVDVQDSVRDARVPAFSLQPIVENAIRHGIAPRATGGSLQVKVSRDDDSLLLEVTDDGPGAAKEELARAEGLGLRLVRKRLAAHYGDAATLEVDTQPGRGFRVKIRLPSRGHEG